MTKEQYLASLSLHLSPLSKEEVKSALAYYNEYFDDAGESNVADVITRLGDPATLAKTIVSDTRDGSGTVDKQASFQPQQFTAIKCTLIHANLSFVVSDSYGFNIDPTTNADFEWRNNNGCLEIKENWLRSFRIFGNILPSTVTVYMPKDAQLTTVSITNKSGNLTLGSFNADLCSLSVVSGNTTLSNTKLATLEMHQTSGNCKLSTCQIGHASIGVISGNVAIHSSTTGGLDISSTSGKIEVTSCTLLGITSTKTVSGTVQMSIHGKPSDYYKTFNILSGSIYINDQKMKSYSDFEKPTTANTLSSSCTSGSIRINFI